MSSIAVILQSLGLRLACPLEADAPDFSLASLDSAAHPPLPSLRLAVRTKSFWLSTLGRRRPIELYFVQYGRENSGGFLDTEIEQVESADLQNCCLSSGGIHEWPGFPWLEKSEDGFMKRNEQQA